MALPPAPLLFHDKEQEGAAGHAHLSPFAELSAGPGEDRGADAILRKLKLVDRNDPIAEIIAKKIIELGQRGVSQAEQLIELAMKELGIE
jgi:hypothetical protein